MFSISSPARAVAVFQDCSAEQGWMHLHPVYRHLKSRLIYFTPCCKRVIPSLLGGTLRCCNAAAAANGFMKLAPSAWPNLCFMETGEDVGGIKSSWCRTSDFYMQASFRSPFKVLSVPVLGLHKRPRDHPETPYDLVKNVFLSQQISSQWKND